MRTLLLQSQDGQILPTHSFAAGLDYPAIGPELAWLYQTQRAESVTVTDEEALRGFKACARLEGIIPSLESAHAVWATMQLAEVVPKEANIVMTLSGRGDKDVQYVYELLSNARTDKPDSRMDRTRQLRPVGAG
ncbi:hypothetical protein JCM10450v2_005658 [Rhodotorula kratochvilovae]